MYERFTDRARKVMQLASSEAQGLNHEYIGTEHILLGLIKEGSGVAANALKNLDIDLRKVRREVERTVGSGPHTVATGKMPKTPRVEKVLECAIEEARRLNHNYVGTEHLLLGLLGEAEGVAAQVLMNFGLKLEEVREEVMRILGINIQTAEDPKREVDPLLCQDLNDALMYLPEEFIQALKEINDHFYRLGHEKEEAVAEQDFQRAVTLRNKEVKFKAQLLDAVKKLQTFIPESDDDSQ